MSTRTKLFGPGSALAACAALVIAGIGMTTGPSSGGSGAEPAQDAQPSLQAADIAWSQTLDDMDTFMSFLAPDVRFLAPDVPLVEGPEAFRLSMEQLLGLPGAKLTWSPDSSRVAGSGELGYTIGSFKLTMDGPDGKPIMREGKYVTAWRRAEGGGWKVVADIFNFDAPPPDVVGEDAEPSER